MIAPLTCLLTLGFTCQPLDAMLSSLDALELPAAEEEAVHAVVVEETVMSASVATPAPVPASASVVLQSVQKFYDATADLQANFEQTYFNPAFGDRPTTTRGLLRLKKPGKMVWDYEGKSNPDFYADGDTLWVIEHDTRQVVSRAVSGDSEVAAAMKFLFGGQELLQEFKVRFAAKARADRYGDAAHHVIELKPKLKSAAYKGLALVVDKTTGRVDQFIVYNQDGSTNHFRLDKVKANNGIADGIFEFRVPRGYVQTKT
jgi:outer membrane lipoprotein carrier protein